MVAVGITTIAAFVWRARGRRQVVPGPLALGMPWENYIQLLTWVPLVIGVHMGVTLLVSGVSGQLFIPNLVLPVNLLAGVLGAAEIAIALGFIYGALTRPAAVALGRLGGLKGGKASAESLTKARRNAIAKQAALARWSRQPKNGQ